MERPRQVGPLNRSIDGQRTTEVDEFFSVRGRVPIETRPKVEAEADLTNSEDSERNEVVQKRLERQREALQAAEKARIALLAEADAARKLREQERMQAEAAKSAARMAVADEEFGGIVLAPSERVILCRTLRTKHRATLELRGPGYVEIEAAHGKRDWLELANFLAGKRLTELPGPSEIRGLAQNLKDREFSLLLKTTPIVQKGKANQELCFHTLGGDVGSSHRLYGEWTRHPDGIGFLRPWKLTSKQSVVVLADPNVFSQRIRQMYSEALEQTAPLETKVKLGEMDRATADKGIEQIMEKMSARILTWAKGL